MSNSSPQRQTVVLTEEQMEELVTRVSTHVINNFYEQVGRSVMSRLLTWIGMVVVAALMIMAGVKALKAVP